MTLVHTPPRSSAQQPETLSWADQTGGSWTRLDIVGGVCVIHAEGALTARALAPWRAALDAACALHPARVVLDLSLAGPAEPITVTLLGAARRHLRTRGATLTLTGVGPDVRQELRAAHVLDLYEIRRSVAAVVA